MKLKTVVGISVVLLGTSPADAAWFCNGRTAKFIEWRTASMMDLVSLGPQSIMFGTTDHVFICNPDNTCHTESQQVDPKEFQADIRRRIDKYKAMATAMHEWAATLSDACLRDGYEDALKEHDRRIREDEEALDFLKSSPEPLAPTS